MLKFLYLIGNILSLLWFYVPFYVTFEIMGGWTNLWCWWFIPTVILVCFLSFLGFACTVAAAKGCLEANKDNNG